MIVEKIDKYEIYRVVTDMEALQDGFRDRVEDLEVTRAEIDAAGNLQSGYAGKLLCKPAIKTIGKESLGRLLTATGMALVLVIDDERFAPVKAMMRKRERPLRPMGSMQRPTWLFTKEMSRLMQDARNQKLSPAMRKKIAKRAAKTRWRRRREALKVNAVAPSDPAAS